MIEYSKKILLVQLFSNGDCLYATAIARQIKQDFPGCRLSWSIAGFCKSIIENNPYVDEIIVTDEVAKNDVVAFRKYKKKVFAENAAGVWDEVFVSTNMDTNLANYDGTIRGMILRGYPNKITVPLQPVLVLTENEISNVAAFAETNNLKSFKNVILWEYAPQSGQSELNFSMVTEAAERITRNESTAVILSSANKFTGNKRIIDASALSVRENAALTYYCSLLIGCSSGLTWVTTSSAAKFLPMLQLLNPHADFINAPSVDFKRYDIPHNGLIELTYFNVEKIVKCIDVILNESFGHATIFHQSLPEQFNTTKKIVYNLLVYREFKSIRKHYRIMTGLYGKRPAILHAFSKAVLNFPFRLIGNLYRKRIKSTSK